MEQSKIEEITRNLLNSYEQKYINWAAKNPGYIMCNYAIKCNVLENNLNECLSLEKIIEKKEWHESLHEEALELYGTSGHFVCAEVLKELIELIKNEEKN